MQSLKGVRLQIYDFLHKNKKAPIFAVFDAVICALIIQFMAWLSHFFINYPDTKLYQSLLFIMVEMMGIEPMYAN